MIISQNDIDRILRFTKEAHPEECCGLLVGTEENVSHIIPSDNVTQGDKTKTFEIDPQVRFDLIRTTGQRSLLGFYHSHPNGIPTPSETDKSMVYEPDLIWVIATLDDIKAFRFFEEQQDFEEIPIQVKL
ncbi:MAG: M67 family metallopeptidase [Methylocystaceae bacterium]|nr:M67 family metallopeptidase [Methylocystaceae bacterium]